MAAPELVICTPGDDFKVYPGGVIVLSAVDWMGGARGTLSSETDARSCCGEVVREQQQTATDLYLTERSNNFTAYNAMDDTLTVDMSLLPMEEGLRYAIAYSALIEGDWDVSNDSTTRQADQEEFRWACSWGVSGDQVFGTNPITAANFGAQWRALDTYRIGDWNFPWTLEPIDPGSFDQTLHFRAYSMSGTTIEYLIDQLYLIPAWDQSGGSNPNWDTSDFAVVPGYNNVLGTISLTNGDYVDGADGGDDQGKFTWHPETGRIATGFAGEEYASGDYQRKADSSTAEYMARVTTDDGYSLENSLTGTEASAHCYGLHGPYFIPEQDWVLDEFTRTEGDGNFAGAAGHFATNPGWGMTPEGFEWTNHNVPPGGTGPTGGTGKSAFVDGSRGIMRIRPSGTTGLNHNLQLHQNTTPTANNAPGARIMTDVLRMSGTTAMENLSVSSFDPVERIIQANIRTYDPTLTNISWPSNFFELELEFYPNFEWRFFLPLHTGGDPPDASGTGWTEVGWKLEVLRFRVRLKIWDASGAEPGTWDFDGFRRATTFGFSGDIDYPYDDDLRVSASNYHFMAPWIQCIVGGVNLANPVDLVFDDIRVWNDPIGDAGLAYVSMEQPEGDEVAVQELPSTCQHIVYWGTRDWTQFVTSDGPYVEFSSRAWNDTTAAELQRSTANWWWFRSVHGGIIPMNWRSSDRLNRRVLVGDR